LKITVRVLVCIPFTRSTPVQLAAGSFVGEGLTLIRCRISITALFRVMGEKLDL
jgi:hypothetical protein